MGYYEKLRIAPAMTLGGPGWLCMGPIAAAWGRSPEEAYWNWLHKTTERLSYKVI